MPAARSMRRRQVKSKSQIKRLLKQDPCVVFHELERLRSENEKLRKTLTAIAAAKGSNEDVADVSVAIARLALDEMAEK